MCYFLKKDLILQSILKPVLKIENNNSQLTIYSKIDTNELLAEYEKQNIRKIDNQYNEMIKDGYTVLIQLKEEEAIKHIINSGFPENAVFSVFKDELLTISSSVLTTFKPVDINNQ